VTIPWQSKRIFVVAAPRNQGNGFVTISCARMVEYGLLALSQIKELVLICANS
jgi:hypothetical protein